MDIKNIKKWVKALRSGDYKQARAALHGKKKNSHCCIGVAQVVCKIGTDEEEEIIEDLGIPNPCDVAEELMKLNDKGHKSFSYIAIGSRRISSAKTSR